MCGLAGVILGTKRRRRTELAEIGERFTELLLQSERRGRHATGIALVDRDGGYHLLKRPVPAREFVELDVYREVLAELSNRTTCILGHTRWPTRGTPAEPLNHQPIRRGRTLGTHNGTILNSTLLAHAYGFRRLCQVDTEVLVRLADEAGGFGNHNSVPWLTTRRTGAARRGVCSRRRTRAGLHRGLAGRGESSG